MRVRRGSENKRRERRVPKKAPTTTRTLVCFGEVSATTTRSEIVLVEDIHGPRDVLSPCHKYLFADLFVWLCARVSSRQVEVGVSSHHHHQVRSLFVSHTVVTLLWISFKLTLLLCSLRHSRFVPVTTHSAWLCSM